MAFFKQTAHSRRGNQAVCVAAMLALASCGALAQTRPATLPAPASLTPLALQSRADAAIERGLSYLLAQQNSEGSFSTGPELGFTGLALLAYLRAGHAPDVGRYGLSIRGAADWLTAEIPGDGDINKVDGSQIYGQVVTTLALCELYGLETDPQRRENEFAALTRLVKAMVDAQAHEKTPALSGGWGKTLLDDQSQVAATTRVLMALDAARRLGIAVEDQPFKKGSDFIWRCFSEDEKSFAPSPGAAPERGATVAALAILLPLHAGDPEKLGPAIERLRLQPIDDQAPFPYFEKWQALRILNRIDPAAGRAIAASLVQSQEADGGWPASAAAQEPGRVYATGLAVLALTAPADLTTTD